MKQNPHVNPFVLFSTLFILASLVFVYVYTQGDLSKLGNMDIRSQASWGWGCEAKCGRLCWNNTYNHDNNGDNNSNNNSNRIQQCRDRIRLCVSSCKLTPSPTRRPTFIPWPTRLESQRPTRWPTPTRRQVTPSPHREPTVRLSPEPTHSYNWD